ncbi:hypothetical protein AAG570_010351 [Ranatra chinensis]|uniref:Uncharacterized protein n=1 Tax=Ranatra chinensis TaxID=642074 RepID=A0ABD0YMQ7_9HEMI
MASKRRNMFYQNKKHETTEIFHILLYTTDSLFASNIGPDPLEVDTLVGSKDSPFMGVSGTATVIFLSSNICLTEVQLSKGVSSSSGDVAAVEKKAVMDEEEAVADAAVLLSTGVGLDPTGKENEHNTTITDNNNTRRRGVADIVRTVSNGGTR